MLLGFGESFTMGIVARCVDGIAQQITNGGMVMLPAFVDVGQRVLKKTGKFHIAFP